MKRTDKEQLVEELGKTFRENNSVLLLTFNAITVPDVTELRQKVGKVGEYRVVKNTLALRAAEGTPVEKLRDHFEGPTAIAFTGEDPVALAKVLKDFVKDFPGLTFKAGVLGSDALSAQQIQDLAEMPSRRELVSKLLFLLNAPLTRLASALQSPLRNLGSVLKQLEEKKGGAEQNNP